MHAQNYMQTAIELAKLGKGHCYTNPLVGAVIVKDQKIIGQGYHSAFGKAHAEIEAINSALVNKYDLTAATIYVTLEPCAHTGKTPPCVAALKKYKFKHVVIGQLDPNPLVAGKGQQALHKAGITTTICNELSRDVEHLNLEYNFFYQQQRPFVTLKYASSFDGKASLIPNTRFQLTCPASLADLYQERANSQAILIGSGTQVIDNPKLTPRQQVKYPPIRILVDHRLRVDAGANLLQTDGVATYIFTQTTQQAKAQQLLATVQKPDLKIFYADYWQPQRIVQQLQQLGIQSVFIEGGPIMHQSFLNAGLIDKLIIYQAPLLFGDASPSVIGSINTQSINYMRFQLQQVTRLDQDLKIIATAKEIKEI